MAFGMWVFPGLFEAIGLPVVKDWVRKHGARYAKYIARHVESPAVDQDGKPSIPPLTEWLLTEFEENKEVFSSFCAGRHSFETRFGHARDHRAEIETQVRPFLNHRLRRVREWAQYELHLSDVKIKMDDDDDEEFQRL